MDNTRVFNQDCMEGMKEFPDKYFELAIVDPPYGINATEMQMGSHPTRVRENGNVPAISTAVKIKKNRMQSLNGCGGKLKNRLLNTSKIDWDYEQPSTEYFEELFRVSKNLIVWGGNYFDLPPSRCVVCWDKLQPWENFSQWELAWTSFDMPARMFRLSNTGGANLESKIHPTQKPIALYKWLLQSYAIKGDKILDTHLGSGSSRIAAFDMGFDFTGYELDKDYFEAQEKRFHQHASQLRLFEPSEEIKIDNQTKLW